MEKHPFLQFCDHYHISYSFYQRGDKKGQLRFLQPRDKDLFEFFDAKDALRNAGYEKLIDHTGYYRTIDGGTVVTFSPWWMPELEDPLPERIGDFMVEVSPYPAYGLMTTTIVMRRAKKT